MDMMDAISQEFQRRMAAAMVRDDVPSSRVMLTEVQQSEEAAAQGPLAIADAATGVDVRAGNSEAAIWM